MNYSIVLLLLLCLPLNILCILRPRQNTHSYFPLLMNPPLNLPTLHRLIQRIRLSVNHRIGR